MADTSTLFSENICNVTEEEGKWMLEVLERTVEYEEDRTRLFELLGVEPDPSLDLDDWPSFNWRIQDKDGESWLYSEGYYDENHLVLFIQSFIRKWRPDYVFAVSSSLSCSRPRIGEFGGSWLVITKDTVEGGTTWGAIEDKLDHLVGKDWSTRNVTNFGEV